MSDLSDDAQSKLTLNVEDLVQAATTGDVAVFNSLSQYELKEALTFRTSGGPSLLQIAASFGNTEVVKFLSIAANPITKGFIETNAPNDGDEDQTYVANALHLALLKGWDILAEMLISHGADLTAQDKDGLTPLHCAAIIGNLELVKLFLDKDVEIDERCNAGRTPLMMAVIHKHLEITLYLIRRGANWTNLDKIYEGGLPLRFRCSDDFSNAIIGTVRELGMFYDQPGHRASRFLPLPPGVRRV